MEALPVIPPTPEVVDLWAPLAIPLVAQIPVHTTQIWLTRWIRGSTPTEIIATTLHPELVVTAPKTHMEVQLEAILEVLELVASQEVPPDTTHMAILAQDMTISRQDTMAQV